MAKGESNNSNLMSGLTKRSPAAVDKSMKIPSSSTVNTDATRSGVAPTPSTISGRVA